MKIFIFFFLPIIFLRKKKKYHSSIQFNHIILVLDVIINILKYYSNLYRVLPKINTDESTYYDQFWDK